MKVQSEETGPSPLAVPTAPAEVQAAQQRVDEIRARLNELRSAEAAARADSSQDQIEAILSGREADAVALIEKTGAETFKREQLIRNYAAALEMARAELETARTKAQHLQRQAALHLIQTELEGFLKQLAGCHAAYQRLASFIADCAQQGIPLDGIAEFTIDAEGQKLAASVQEAVRRFGLDPGIVDRLGLPHPWTVGEPVACPAEEVQATVSQTNQVRPVGQPAASVYRLEAYMPEKVAALKIEGFAKEYGGTIVESSPGLIRLQLPMLRRILKPSGKSGIVSWLGLKPKFGKVSLELHLTRKDNQRQGYLNIEVVMRPKGKLTAPEHEEWQTSCELIMVDLRGFLMSHT